MKSWLVVALAVTACRPKPNAMVNEPLYDNPGHRAELFEATLRMLDEHPDYVDELTRLTLRHPKTLQRQFEATARYLADDDVARLHARALVANPRGLERLTIETFDAAEDNPSAQRAIVDAVQQRSEFVATAFVNRPRDFESLMKSMLPKAWASEETKPIMEKVMEQISNPQLAARRSWRPKK